MNWPGIPSVCVSPMWPNIMNINDCNTWQLSDTRYGNRVRWLFPCLHGLEMVVIWFMEDIFCLAFAISLIIRGYGYIRFVNAVLQLLHPSNHLHEGQVLLICKSDTRVIFFQSIAPPTKCSSAWFIQTDYGSDFTFKNGNTASFCR